MRSTFFFSRLAGYRQMAVRVRSAVSWAALAMLPGSLAFANPYPADAPAAPTFSGSPTFSQEIARRLPVEASLQTRILVEGLQHPWSMAWLPNGDLLVTERVGRLRRITPDGQLDPRPIAGLPENLVVEGQGGLLDIALHPEYARNGWIYLSYVEAESGGWVSRSGTALARARLEGHRLVDWQPLFHMEPKSRGGRHFGGRIAFDAQNHVYLTLGDRGEESRAQQFNDHAGTVIRLHDDGRIPADNPFLNDPRLPDASFTRGNRNIQGAAIHPQTGELWTHEHGPQGGDEINILRSGRNYGWPVVTYGVNYVTGTRIGAGTHQEGMEQPVHVWVPSIAPSGMAFYQGDVFPHWQGSVLIGALRGQMLVRLELDGDRVVAEEHWLIGQVGRIRDVRVGPDGFPYLLTDSPQGRLIRVEP